MVFFKCAIPGLFFKQTLHFLQQYNVNNVHPVSGAGIQTHDIMNHKTRAHTLTKILFGEKPSSVVYGRRIRLIWIPVLDTKWTHTQFSGLWTRTIGVCQDRQETSLPLFVIEISQKLEKRMFIWVSSCRHTR